MLPLYRFLSYVEALPNAQLVQVVKALDNTVEFLGKVPWSVKSDNIKQWVTKSCKYEPVLTAMVEQWSNHNNIIMNRYCYYLDKFLGIKYCSFHYF